MTSLLPAIARSMRCRNGWRSSHPPPMGRSPRSCAIRNWATLKRGLGMYTLAVSDHVMIAHSFVGEIFGPAQRLHGATFAVEMEVRRAQLDADGLVCDIGRALATLKEILAALNYRNL